MSQCSSAMHKNLKKDYVQQVPTAERETAPGRCWYIQVFPVEQVSNGIIRLVYDASATYDSHSLNKALLRGPDLTNQLREVLCRFREHPVGMVNSIW